MDTAKGTQGMIERGSTLFDSRVSIITNFLLFACVEAVFLNSELDSFLGPVLACLFCYLYFVKKETVMVSIFIIIANDALGTVIGGRISFVYLLLVFIFFEAIRNPETKLRNFILSCVSILAMLQLFLIGDAEFNAVFKTTIFILALMTQYQKYNSSKEEFMDRFMVSLAIIILLISVQTLLTGGVIYKEAEVNPYFQEYQRRGVLGMGIGDPNFSSLLLCTGLVATINSRLLSPLVKSFFSVTIVATMAVTLSTAGAIGCLLVILLSAILNEKLSRGVRNVFIVALILVMAFTMYTSLPEGNRNSDVDEYITRMVGKIGSVLSGNMYSATSGRSKLTTDYLDYIKSSSLLRLMFGGSSIVALGTVSHNTYIDTMLRFGLLGLSLFIIHILIRMFRIYKIEKTNFRKANLVLKSLYAFFILSLSVYQGSTFALMFFVLLVL